MKVGPKLIVLVRDADGLGPAIFDGLHAGPDSTLIREASHFELSLDKYGVPDRGASGELVHFLDQNGSPQVSIILLPNYEPPIAACAVNEILASIMSDNSSELPTIIVPLFLSSHKTIQVSTNVKSSKSGATIFGVGRGLITEPIQALLDEIPRPPPSLQVTCETLACLLQMIDVLQIPTIVVATIIKRQGIMAKAWDLKGLSEIGEFLANHTGVSFSEDKMCWREAEKVSVQEPWRALYG